MEFFSTLDDSANFALRLSEKGYEQRSNREYGWDTEGEINQNPSLRQPATLRCKRLGSFSDSFRR
jgi:hypothetical protein